MRRLTVVPLVLGVCALAAGCASDEGAPEAKKPQGRGYFGWVLGSPNVTGIAIQADPAGSDGTRRVRVYVCDGLGPPQGKAVWFGGTVNPRAASTHLTSAGGQESLDVDGFNDRLVKGTFTDSTGARTQFVSYPARDGAGIYQVTLHEDFTYTGVSLDGSRLRATADRASGAVSGTIRTRGGKRLSFRIRTLALATPAELEQHGLTTDYTQFKEQNLVPGEYVAVVSPSSTHWLGRSGLVTKGQPGLNIIGLDKKE